MKIYLASSWRNKNQPMVVKLLRELGHEVYDFRNPVPGITGFSWDNVDVDWMFWKTDEFVDAIKWGPQFIEDGFHLDKSALDQCDTCVLLLPCGRSAHLEVGYAIGQGKPTIIVLDQEKFEPELMYLLADAVVPNLTGLPEALDGLRSAS